MNPIIFQIAAMLLSPLIALRVSQSLSDRKEKRKRKLEIFHTLMATRGSLGAMGRMAPEHVKALNMIDIEFHGDKKSKPILDAWKAYLDHLNNSAPPNTQPALEVWNAKRDDLLVDLLYAMSLALGYDYDKTFIRRTTYAPWGTLNSTSTLTCCARRPCSSSKASARSTSRRNRQRQPQRVSLH